MLNPQGLIWYWPILCSYNSYKSSGNPQAFHKGFFFKWKLSTIFPEAHSWRQTLKLNEKGWVVFSTLIHPKGFLLGRGQGGQSQVSLILITSIPNIFKSVPMFQFFDVLLLWLTFWSLIHKVSNLTLTHALILHFWGCLNGVFGEKNVHSSSSRLAKQLQHTNGKCLVVYSKKVITSFVFSKIINNFYEEG